MRKSVSILLIALFATAVCADELKAAAGAGPRADVMESPATLVQRISSNLRRMVKPALSFQLDRQPASIVSVSRRVVKVDAPRFEHPPLQPFQFRLPPPLA